MHSTENSKFDISKPPRRLIIHTEEIELVQDRIGISMKIVPWNFDHINEIVFKVGEKKYVYRKVEDNGGG